MSRDISIGRSYGPAMKALLPKQQRFVVALLELGTTNYKRAAEAAGYGQGQNKNSIYTIAGRMAHDEKILRALNEEAKRRLMASAPMAISELVKIAEDPVGDKKYKLKAIEMILNRTGHHALSEHRVDVQHTYSDGDAVQRIQALSKTLGLDPVKLLGSAGVKFDDKGAVIDVEFSEVEDEEDDNFDYQGTDE